MQRDVERALKRVKEQMRAVPQHGIGYGLLRYKAAQKEVSKVLDRGEQAQVCFNYLGQYQEMAEGIIGLASEMKGQEIADSAQMLYKLEINSYVVGGKLRMEWTFSEREYERKTVEGLAHRYMEHLQELIEVCTSEHAGGYTPSDFPEANLSQEELDELLAEFGESIASA